jgi:hypothetical protein
MIIFFSITGTLVIDSTSTLSVTAGSGSTQPPLIIQGCADISGLLIVNLTEEVDSSVPMTIPIASANCFGGSIRSLIVYTPQGCASTPTFEQLFPASVLTLIVDLSASTCFPSTLASLPSPETITTFFLTLSIVTEFFKTVTVF